MTQQLSLLPELTVAEQAVAPTVGRVRRNNPPTSTGRGCNNFGAFSGGAILSATGTASLSADSVVFNSSGENATAPTIFLQGTTQIATGIVFGAGIRCVGGTLKRLYLGNASGGSITRPAPGDPHVSARSAQLGDTIFPNTHRFYMAYYRDPLAAGPCGDPARTFNSSESVDILWTP